MHDFKEDFYGSMLSVVMLGFIRGEENFSSLGRHITTSNFGDCILLSIFAYLLFMTACFGSRFKFFFIVWFFFSSNQSTGSIRKNNLVNMIDRYKYYLKWLCGAHCSDVKT